MDTTSPGDPRVAASPFVIGDPGRTARELPAGLPAAPAGHPDVELTAATVPGMVIRAATVRGLLHRFNGTVGQDAFALAQYAAEGGPAQAVAVVCDGVGALGRSDEAARLVSRCLADLGAAGEFWPDAFVRANEEVRALAKEAAASGGGDADIDGMATTAMAASVCRVLDEWRINGAWVGDSTLWHLSGDGRWTALAGLSDEDGGKAYHSTGVRPLPSADGACAAGDFIVRSGAIFLMSDGVGNPLHWSSEVRETLARWWLRPPDPFSFAAQVSFARRSHIDDRTVVGIWAEPAQAAPVPPEEPAEAVPAIRGESKGSGEPADATTDGSKRAEGPAVSKRKGRRRPGWSQKPPGAGEDDR
jgi:Protein phosphatase 2C